MDDEQLRRFQEGSQELFTSGMALASALDVKRLKTARDEVVAIIEGTKRSAQEPELRTIVTVTLEGYLLAFQRVLDLAPEAGVIVNSAKTLIPKISVQAGKIATLPDRELTPEARLVVANAIATAKIEPYSLYFWTGIASISLVASYEKMTEISEAFLERRAGSLGIWQRIKAIWRAVGETLADTAVPGVNLGLTILKELTTPQIEKDIEDLRKAASGIDRLFLLRRLVTETHTQAASSGAIIKASSSAATQSLEEMLSESALVLAAFGED